MSNDYTYVIKRSEDQFWAEFRNFQVHEGYLQMFKEELLRIHTIPEDKRTDLEKYRYPRLPNWIKKQTEQCNNCINRCMFFHNAIKDLETIMALNDQK